MSKILAVVAVVALAGSYYIGYSSAETDHALKSAEHNLKIEGEYRAKEKELSAKLAKALDELNRSRGDVARLNRDLDRVRVDAKLAEDRLSHNAGRSADTLRGQLKEAVGHIESCSRLVGECVNFSSDVVAKHKALSDMVQ